MAPSLGSSVMARRLARGMTRLELAARCREVCTGVSGVSADSIKWWERGFRNRRPSLAQLEVLSRALGLGIADRAYLLELALNDARARAGHAPSTPDPSPGVGREDSQRALP